MSNTVNLSQNNNTFDTKSRAPFILGEIPENFARYSQVPEENVLSQSHDSLDME